MSGQKYYENGIKPYEGGFGKFYYDKTSGSGSPNPQLINWMSNINLSRTDRFKTMYVNPVGHQIPSHSIDISLSKSNLLLLIGCINGDQSNNVPLDMIANSPYRESGCTYYATENQLEQVIDIIVLTNGNVLDVDLVDNGGIVASVDNKDIYYYSVTDDDIPMAPTGGHPQTNEVYLQYPTLSSGSSLPIYTYIGNELVGRNYTRAKGGFDSITCGDNNKVSEISILEGGILVNENKDYSEYENLVAVKIKVHLAALEYAGIASRVKVVTAVYDSEGEDGVSSEYDEYKAIYIEFRLNSEGASIDGDDTLNFDEQGAINGDHDVETSITATVPWTIGEYDTGSNE